MAQSIITNPRNIIIMPVVSPKSSDQLLNSQVMETQEPDSMAIPEPELAEHLENNVDEENHRGGDDSNDGSEDEDDLDLLLAPTTANQLICLRCGSRVAATVNLRRHTSKYHPEVEVEMFEFLVKKAVELYPRIYAEIQSQSSKPTISNVHSVGGATTLEPETSTSSSLGEGLCGSGNLEVSVKYPTNIITAPKSNQNSAYCHGGEKSFKCGYCGIGWTNKSEYDRHLRTHTGERPFICHECGKGFSQKGSLKQHMMKHTGEKPFFCQQCNRAFRSARSLREDALRHKGEFPIACPHCNKRFIQKTQLKQHLAIHSGEPACTCKQCGKIFAYKQSLVNHLRSHSDERPYACDQCTKAFKYSSILRNHLKVHTGRKSQLQ